MDQDEALDLEGSNQDRRLMNRAIQERWPIPAGKRTKIVNRLMKVAETAKDVRASASAARTLARMDALNQADEHADRHYERIDDNKPTDLVRFDGITIDVPGITEPK